MTQDKVAILIGAFGLTWMIYWFFLGKRENEEQTESVEEARIKVEGGYSPALINVPVNQEVKLTFNRSDPTDCLEEVVFPELKIKRALPLNTDVVITLKIEKAGSYEWHCGMNMFHGKLVAV